MSCENLASGFCRATWYFGTMIHASLDILPVVGKELIPLKNGLIQTGVAGHHYGATMDNHILGYSYSTVS